MEAAASAELARAGFRDARRAVDRSFTLVSQSRLLNVPGLQPLTPAPGGGARVLPRLPGRWGDEPELRRTGQCHLSTLWDHLRNWK